MITNNKAQIIINVMKLLALHILFSFFITLSMPSEGNAEERDVSKNAQITTNLYMIIQTWAFNANPNRFIAMNDQSIRNQGKFVWDWWVAPWSFGHLARLNHIISASTRATHRKELKESFKASGRWKSVNDFQSLTYFGIQPHSSYLEQFVSRCSEGLNSKFLLLLKPKIKVHGASRIRYRLYKIYFVFWGTLI